MHWEQKIQELLRIFTSRLTHKNPQIPEPRDAESVSKSAFFKTSLHNICGMVHVDVAVDVGNE